MYRWWAPLGGVVSFDVSAPACLRCHRTAVRVVQASKWRDAIAAYTEAIAVNPDNAVYNAKLYGNRAAAHIK